MDNAKITNYFKPVNKRKDPPPVEESKSIEPLSTKKSKKNPKEIALQELSIHAIALVSVDKKSKPLLSLEGCIERIVSVYNQQRKHKNKSEYQPITFTHPPQDLKPFSFSAFIQAVPIRSKVFSYLDELGGHPLETATKINYLFFLYREESSQHPRELFSLTTGDAWRVVQKFSDYTFPPCIARRLLDASKISISNERFLVGDTLSLERTARNFSSPEKPLDSLVTSMRCLTRATSSLFHLPCFREGNKLLLTNFEIGAGGIRICKLLPMASYPSILHLFSTIIQGKTTSCYTDPPQKETDDPGFNFLDYFTPASSSKIKELKQVLQRMVWEAFQKKSAPLLDFRHKFSSSYSKASSFSLHYREGDKAFEHTWHTVHSTTEMIQLLHRLRPFSGVTEEQFLKKLSSVKVSFTSGGKTEKAPFLDYLEGLVRDEEGNPFWRIRKQWYAVSKDYLEHVQEEFEQLVNSCLVPSDFLPKRWPSETEVDKMKITAGNQRHNTEAYYNELFLEEPGWILGDRICPRGIELFDLLYRDKERLYLIHVKQGFGIATRDACSQIRNAASFLHDALSHQSAQNKLEEFYTLATEYESKGNDQAYRSKAKEKLLKEFPRKQDFVQHFLQQKQPLTFVYAFVDTGEGVRLLRKEQDAEQNMWDLHDDILSLSAEEEDPYAVWSLLQTQEFLNEAGALTQQTQVISQTEFFKKFPLGSQKKRKQLYDTLCEQRDLSKTTKSTVSKLELLHLQRELRQWNFDFKICQIARTDYPAVSVKEEINGIEASEDESLTPVASADELSSSSEEDVSDDESEFGLSESSTSSTFTQMVKKPQPEHIEGFCLPTVIEGNCAPDAISQALSSSATFQELREGFAQEIHDNKLFQQTVDTGGYFDAVLHALKEAKGDLLSHMKTHPQVSAIQKMIENPEAITEADRAKLVHFYADYIRQDGVYMDLPFFLAVHVQNKTPVVILVRSEDKNAFPGYRVQTATPGATADKALFVIFNGHNHYLAVDHSPVSLARRQAILKEYQQLQPLARLKADVNKLNAKPSEATLHMIRNHIRDLRYGDPSQYIQLVKAIPPFLIPGGQLMPGLEEDLLMWALTTHLDKAKSLLAGL